ncbi:MAG TPA: hypothetical protein VKK31_13410 [Thermoanaerobaculia bacterium]|nr:hypothetical protein [Thermoanaerobaculia bacterium]
MLFALCTTRGGGVARVATGKACLAATGRAGGAGRRLGWRTACTCGASRRGGGASRRWIEDATGRGGAAILGCETLGWE